MGSTGHPEEDAGLLGCLGIHVAGLAFLPSATHSFHDPVCHEEETGSHSGALTVLEFTV